MTEILLALLYVALYCYYVFQILAIGKGKLKNIVAWGLAIMFLAGGEVLHYPWVGAFLMTLTVFLFTLFYADEPIVGKRFLVCVPGLLIIIEGILRITVYAMQPEMFFAVFLWMMFLLLSKQRGYLNWKNAILVTAVEFGVLFLSGKGIYKGIILFLLFFLLESTLREYQMGYESNARDLQNRLMQQQYEEIKGVYLNLRGWRHDYHNHIQALKAFLDGGQEKEARNYLNEIETELEKVDSFVRSGNLMVDAILNSKITQAMNKEIQVTCDATVGEQLFISDMDMCIILGNVLDNAIESCEKIPKEQRFLRIYMAIVKEQLYISIQNAAPEILNFEEKNYISTKRGNHGLGMKRVAAVVEKREGYLNLNNEPGIFGTEITIPKPVENAIRD